MKYPIPPPPKIRVSGSLNSAPITLTVTAAAINSAAPAQKDRLPAFLHNFHLLLSIFFSRLFYAKTPLIS
jgi:hypothetical protein